MEDATFIAHEHDHDCAIFELSANDKSKLSGDDATIDKVSRQEFSDEHRPFESVYLYALVHLVRRKSDRKCQNDANASEHPLKDVITHFLFLLHVRAKSLKHHLVDELTI